MGEAEEAGASWSRGGVRMLALPPVAYTLGAGFKPALRKPLETVLHLDRW